MTYPSTLYTAPATRMVGDPDPADDFNTLAAEMEAVQAALGADSAEWDDWTPSLGNLTPGSGATQVYRYKRIGDWIVGYFVVVLGTSPTVGTVTISAPVAGSSNYVDQENAVGIGHYRDATGSRYEGQVSLTSAQANLLPRVADVSGTYPTLATLAAGVPFTWAASDTIFGTFSYEAA